jgi:hypothetical protein
VLAAGARNATVTRASIGLGFGVSVVGNDVMAQVAQVASERTVKVVNDYLRKTQRQVSRRAGLENMHERVGNKAKQSMLDSYRALVGNKPNQGYRPQSRLTGKMYDALSSMKPRVSRDSVEVVDFSYLDRKAAHWRRLNYGTEGSVAQKAPGSFPLRSAEGTFGFLMDRTFPSSGFTLPKGFWTDLTGKIVPFGARNPSHLFFPASEQVSATKRLEELRRERPGGPKLLAEGRRSRGIRGYRFTDAALRTLAREYPNELLTVAERWFLESQRAIQPVQETVSPS